MLHKSVAAFRNCTIVVVLNIIQMYFSFSIIQYHLILFNFWQ